MNKIQVYKLDTQAILPTRTYSSDAGIDLYALENTFIPIWETKVVKTGIAINIPVGYYGKIFDRSSMGRKGLIVGSGVIDSGYAGSVDVVLHNFSNKENYLDIRGHCGYQIKKGDKIAQVVICKVETPEVTEVEQLWESERKTAGWGSSGR